MAKISLKVLRQEQRKHKVNTVIKTTSSLPRLIVNRSNKFIVAQVIDQKGKVLAVANDHTLKAGTKTEHATKVGAEIAKKTLAAGVSKVVFDRNGYLYHGRVKALAEGARE